MGTAAARRDPFRHFIPQTRLGWLAVALAIGVGLFVLIANIDGALGLETTDFAPAIVIPGGLSILCGLAAAIVGIISIGARERSVLVFLAVAVGVIYAGSWIYTIIAGFSGSAPPSGPRPTPPYGPPS